MADDLNSLVAQRSSMRTERDARKNEANNLEEKKKRLISAKKNLENYRNSFDKEKVKDKNTIAAKREWTGSNYRNYKEVYGENILNKCNKEYYDNIGDIIERIKKDIDNIQNEINNKWTWFDKLVEQLKIIQSRINSFYS